MPEEKKADNQPGTGQADPGTGADSATQKIADGTTTGADGQPTDKGQPGKDTPFHEHPRFKELISEKNELRKAFEEEKKKGEEYSKRLTEMEIRFNPPKEEEPVDIFTNPEKFVEKVFEKKESAYKERIAALESKLSNESVVKAEEEILGGFEKNPVLQKVFKDKEEYKGKIFDVLVKHGYKDKILTGEILRSANTLLMQEKQGDIINAAMEFGKEQERLNRTDIDESGSDLSNRGKPNPKATKDKLTSEQKRAASKMGLNIEDLEKDEVERYIDSNGKITSVIAQQ